MVVSNAADKSTLVKANADLFQPASRAVHCSGLAARHVAYLPRATEIDRTFPITILDTVRLATWHDTGAFRSTRSRVARLTEQALAAVGLSGHAGCAVAGTS